LAEKKLKSNYNSDGLINYLIPLSRDSMSSSPAYAVFSVGFGSPDCFSISPQSLWE